MKRALQFDAAACGLDDVDGPSPYEDEYDSPIEGFVPDEPLEINSHAGGDSVDALVGENPTPEDAENDPDVTHDLVGDQSLEESLDKEVEKQERTYKTTPAHRKNSTDWHKKWISKGVPRTQEPKGVVKPKASVSKDRPQNLVQAKDSFISQWIKDSNLPPSNDRRKEAIKAWMESPLRANLLAGRAGIQK